MIEALLVIPLFILIMQGMLWLGQLGRAKIIMTMAVREAARCVSQGQDGFSVARRICLDNCQSIADQISIDIRRNLLQVEARASYEVTSPFTNGEGGSPLVIRARAVMPRAL